MDDDDSGSITREEYFKAITENERVMDALADLGLEEETDLFDILDTDNGGTLEFQEFFEGVTLIMKGTEPALAKDMVATYLLAKTIAQNVQELTDGQARHEM